MTRPGWFTRPLHVKARLVQRITKARLFKVHSDTACMSGSGRVDAQKADATNWLPAEDFSADRLKQAFQQQGLSVQEFVALAGAHTVRLSSKC